LPFLGKIITLFAKAATTCRRCDALHIDSPTLTAESTLVSAAGTLNLTRARFERAEQLYEVQGVAQKD